MNYRCAVIGTGRIGSLLEKDELRPTPCTHAGGYYHHEMTTLTSGCDISKKRRDLFEEQWNIPCYHSYRDLISAVKPDIISIASYTHTHFKIAEYALLHGVRGIICEKPMALSLAQGKRITELCRKKGARFIVNHSRRYEYRYQQVKSMIQSGVIGKIRTIYGNILTGRPVWATPDRIRQLAGGPLSHDGTHLMDIFCYYLGAPRWVQAQVSRSSRLYCAEDRATGTIGFDNGAIALFEAGGKRKYYNFEIDIQGSRGRIIIGNSKFQIFTAQPSPRYEQFVELKRQQAPPAENQRNFFLQCVDDIINSIENRITPISSEIDGYNAMECIEAIYLSHMEKKKIHMPIFASRINAFQKLARRWTA